LATATAGRLTTHCEAGNAKFCRDSEFTGINNQLDARVCRAVDMRGACVRLATLVANAVAGCARSDRPRKLTRFMSNVEQVLGSLDCRDDRARDKAENQYDTNNRERSP
jgi:hypothetical protein